MIWTYFLTTLFLAISVFAVTLWFNIGEVELQNMCDTGECSVAMKKLKGTLTYLLIIAIFGLLGFAYGLSGILGVSDVFGMEANIGEGGEHKIVFAMVVAIFCLVFGILFVSSEACKDLQATNSMFLWMPISIISIGGLAALYTIYVMWRHHELSKGGGPREREIEMVEPHDDA